MMTITINGDTKEIAEGQTVHELLAQLQLLGKYVAVECNRQIVSFRDYQTTILAPGDSLEIVSLVGGG